MDLNQLFENKNVSLKIGRVVNNLDEELQFKRNDNTIVTVPANDSVQWGFSLLPLQQRMGLNLPANQTSWTTGGAIDITTPSTTATGILGITATVINNATINFDILLNFRGHDFQNLNVKYTKNKREISFGDRYIIDLVIGNTQDESSILVSRDSSMEGPR